MSKPGGGGKSRGRKRDGDGIKRKRGGGKAATSRSGKPRSKVKTKVKGTGPVVEATPKQGGKGKKGSKARRSGGFEQQPVMLEGEDNQSVTRGRPKPPRGFTPDKKERGKDPARGGPKGSPNPPVKAAQRGLPAGPDSAPPISRIGVIVKRGRKDTAEPIFGPGPRRPIDSGGRDQPRLREGDLVLLPPLERDRSGLARVERVVGRVENARDVLEALMLDRGLSREFPKAVEAEAEAVSSQIEAGDRTDLRDLTTFTIDPTSARDFDDAISAELLPNGQSRVWVHIADVSAFVRPGSKLDNEARRRSTSVYVPGAVEPMIPHSLSSGACSLLPGEDRLAVTIRMDFDGPDCVASEVSRSIIRSDERLDYDEVDRILRGEVAAREPWATPLEVARAVSLALAARRAERHALAINRPEPEFIFDEDGNVTGWRQVEQTESHRLIEMLMVAANSEIARILVERKAPALHRVHEKPDPAKVEVLLDRLASLDIPTPAAPKSMSPSDGVRISAEASVLVDHWTRKENRGRLGITTLVLRALQQARYDEDPLGHSGLGLEDYCHFTSPIRRYPDIVVHRAILSSLGLGEEKPAAGTMGELGEWTSAREREAMVIERDADDIVSCFLLAKELSSTGADTVFDGEIVGVIGAGLFVDFGGGFEGMLPVRRLKDGWWDLNAEQTMLVADTGKRLRLGDQIKVEVGRVDCPRGRCDLYPVVARD
ncbi:MAG: RNB domain-containing ribonuclease [Actinomycetes bacterium]